MLLEFCILSILNNVSACEMRLGQCNMMSNPLLLRDNLLSDSITYELDL